MAFIWTIVTNTVQVFTRFHTVIISTPPTWSMTVLMLLWCRWMFLHLWFRFRFLTSTLCTVALVFRCSRRSVASRPAVSIACAIFIAPSRVSADSASSLFCTDSFFIPQTNLSLIVSFKVSPKLQWMDSFLSSATYIRTVSLDLCSRLWNRNRSAITDGFGQRCLFKCCRICSYVRSAGLVGATMFFNSPYVLAPITAKNEGTNKSADTPLALK